MGYPYFLLRRSAKPANVTPKGWVSVKPTFATKFSQKQNNLNGCFTAKIWNFKYFSIFMLSEIIYIIFIFKWEGGRFLAVEWCNSQTILTIV
ncbi:hypothetical protein CSUIS_1539 [Campylobacter porcelli]|uniref:Uncharacterized protein n=1 Tax=Campylobacter porcelli TaxID=1660073 RepID=A0A1X9SYN7_9BACT|nr:hypothetical protein CSUIS_1539 [Campylobacter sp. RM6137]